MRPEWDHCQRCHIPQTDHFLKAKCYFFNISSAKRTEKIWLTHWVFNKVFIKSRWQKLWTRLRRKKHMPQVWVPSRHAPMVSIRITKWISVRKLIPCQPFHPRQRENDHCLRQSLWLFQNLQFWPKNNFADYTMRTCLVTDKQTFFRAISLSYQSFLITVKKGFYLQLPLQK